MNDSGSHGLEQHHRREDVLVSVGFVEPAEGPEASRAIAEIACALRDRFRFWEILILLDVDQVPAHLPLVRDVENVRLLQMRHRTGFYRRRVLVAEEAIGDVV